MYIYIHKRIGEHCVSTRPSGPTQLPLQAQLSVLLLSIVDSIKPS